MGLPAGLRDRGRRHGPEVVIPTDASYAAYYDQAISKTAPHPAAARLWEEFLYSTTGQNLWLEGQARPIELSTLVSDGTVDQTAYAALPPAPSGTLRSRLRPSRPRPRRSSPRLV